MTSNKELVLTGHKEIWPKNTEEAIFLGPWCFTGHNSVPFSDYTKHKIIPSPWDSKDDILNACYYIDGFIEKIVPSLALFFNQYYKTDFSEKFWNTTLCVWLTNWLGILYSHYKNLEKANDFLSYPVLVKINDSINIKRLYNQYDVFVNASNHDYHIFLFSEILLQTKFDNLIPEIKKYDLTLTRSSAKKTNKIKSMLKNIYHQFFPTDVFWGGINGLNRKERLLLRIVRRKKYIIKESRFIAPQKTLETYIPRYKLEFSCANNFELIVKKILLQHIPEIFFKGIPALEKYEQVKYWIDYEILSSSTVAFKIARIRENNGKWYSIQHGGGYGQKLCNSYANTEYRIADKFITWGWNHKHQYQGEYLPLPGFKLCKLKKHNEINDKIIFIGGLNPPFRYRLQSELTPEELLFYLQDRNAFLGTLNNTIRQKILFKPYSHDFGIGELKSIKKVISNRQIINFKTKNAMNYALSSRLTVIDAMRTSFLECLATDTPTVAYCRNNIFSLIDEAKKDLIPLIDVKILHPNPISAAEHINNVYNNVEGWWGSGELQKAKDKFINKYAFTSDKYLSQWKFFIKSLD